MGSVTEQYVCVHVPSFPAQARLRLRPEQVSKPVAILEGEPPLQTVCSATAAAHSMGVALGMTKVELDTFDGLDTMARSLIEERATQSAVLEMTAAFTPRIEIVPSDHSLVCVLDMTGTELIFGNLRQVLDSVGEAVKKLGLIPRIAGGHNFQACVCAAPFARKQPWVLPRGGEAACLGNLPLSALSLTEEQSARMDLWGVRTLAQLGALPERDLIARLGQAGKHLRELALGRQPHLMVPEEPSLRLEDALEFEAPEERLEALLFVAGPMLDQLIARAQAHALALASVTFCLTLDGGGEHVRTLKPALPLTDRALLLKLLHLDIQSHPPSAAMTALRVTAEPGRRGNVQTGLFSPQLPEAAQLDVTLARIEALVGEEHVGSPRLLDTHRPDSFVMERFRVTDTSRPHKSCTTSAMLRRLRPAVLLRVWLDTATGHPLSFAFESRRYSVAAAFGPWRISGEWWSENVWAKEEWDVQAACGERVLFCVLTHNLLHHDWRLEALYD